MFFICNLDPLSSLKDSYNGDSKVGQVIVLMDKADALAERELSKTRMCDFDCFDDYVRSLDTDRIMAKDAKRYRRILKKVKVLVKEKPHEPELRVLLGECYEHVPECYKKRVREYERAIKLSYGDTRFRKILCVSLWDEAMRLPTYDLIRSSLTGGRGAPSEWLEDIEPEFGKGQLRRFKGLVERCLHICDELLKIDSGDSCVHRLRADILAHQAVDRVEEALEGLVGALELCGEDEKYGIRESLGELLMMYGSDKEALEHFEVVLEYRSAQGWDESPMLDREELEELIEECQKRLQVEVLVQLICCYIASRY